MKIIHVTCGMKNIIWKEIIEFILRQARGGLIFGGKGGGGGLTAWGIFLLSGRWAYKWAAYNKKFMLYEELLVATWNWHQPPPQAIRFLQGRGEWLGMNHKGPLEGYRWQAKPVVSFPPSFARPFSSRERRLGTRQEVTHIFFFKDVSRPPQFSEDFLWIDSYEQPPPVDDH